MPLLSRDREREGGVGGRDRRPLESFLYFFLLLLLTFHVLCLLVCSRFFLLLHFPVCVGWEIQGSLGLRRRAVIRLHRLHSVRQRHSAHVFTLFYKKKEEETRCIDPKGKEWKESKESEYVSLSTLSSQFDEVRENGRNSLASATSFFLSLSLFLRSESKKDHERKRAGKNRGFSFSFSFRRFSSSAPLGSLWWGSFLPLSSSFLFTGKETQHSRRSQLWRPARKYNSPLSPFLSFFSLFFLLLIISSFDHFEFFFGLKFPDFSGENLRNEIESMSTQAVLKEEKFKIVTTIRTIRLIDFFEKIGFYFLIHPLSSTVKKLLERKTLRI